jgi:hypothetical protein
MSITASVKKWRDSQQKESQKNNATDSVALSSEYKAFQMSANYEDEHAELKKRIPEFIEMLEVNPTTSVQPIAPISQNYTKIEHNVNTGNSNEIEESPVYPREDEQEEENSFLALEESEQDTMPKSIPEESEDSITEEDDWDKEMKEFTQGLFEEYQETEPAPVIKNRAKKVAKVHSPKVEKKQEENNQPVNAQLPSWEEEDGNFNLENLLKSMSNREKGDVKVTEEKEIFFHKRHRKNDKKHSKEKEILREREKEREKVRSNPREDKPSGDNRKKRYRWV